MKRCALISLTIGWCLMQRPDLIAEERGTIRVSLTDPFGSDLKSYSLELQSLDGRVIAAGEGRREFRDVAYDEYRLIARSECCVGERRIILNVPDLWVRFGVPIRYGDSDLPGGFLEIRGAVRPRSDLSPTHWVRIRGLFLEFSRETELDTNGKFSFSGLDMGSYLIEIFRADKLISTRTIEIDIKQQISEVVMELRNSR